MEKTKQHNEWGHRVPRTRVLGYCLPPLAGLEQRTTIRIVVAGLPRGAAGADCVGLALPWAYLPWPFGPEDGRRDDGGQLPALRNLPRPFGPEDGGWGDDGQLPTPT
jgi:hypothetical protein